MSDLTADLSAWTGKSQSIHETLDPARSNALRIALGGTGSAAHNDLLPITHHWLYFWDVRAPSGLGVDGHPAKGGFLPPVPLPRRMWAGGRLNFHKPLHFGERVEKTSTIQKVTAKDGRSGPLVFVTLVHELKGEAGLAISEEQDLVYREANTAAPAPLPAPITSVPPCDAHQIIMPDNVLLFRYSALTMNGHRIHYDEPYARAKENYPALVVHGPLQACLLASSAEQMAKAPLKSFSFRGQSPAFAGMDLHVCGQHEGTDSEGDDRASDADSGGNEASDDTGTIELWTQQGEDRNMIAKAHY